MKVGNCTSTTTIALLSITAGWLDDLIQAKARATVTGNKLAVYAAQFYPNGVTERGNMHILRLILPVPLITQINPNHILAADLCSLDASCNYGLRIFMFAPLL